MYPIPLDNRYQICRSPVLFAYLGLPQTAPQDQRSNVAQRGPSPRDYNNSFLHLQLPPPPGYQSPLPPSPRPPSPKAQGMTAGPISGDIGTVGLSLAQQEWNYPHKPLRKKYKNAPSRLHELIGTDPRPVIETVILSSMKRKMVLSEIYKALEESYPALFTAGKVAVRQWHTNVRAILTIYNRFKRQRRDPSDKRKPKGSYWTVDVNATGTAPRNRNPKKQKAKNTVTHDEQRLETDQHELEHHGTEQYQLDPEPEPVEMVQRELRPIEKAMEERGFLPPPPGMDPLLHERLVGIPAQGARQFIGGQHPLEPTRRPAGPLPGAGTTSGATSSTAGPVYNASRTGGRHQVPPQPTLNFYASFAGYAAQPEHERVAMGSQHSRFAAGDMGKDIPEAPTSDAAREWHAPP